MADTDTVTSSAVATGDVAGLKAREQANAIIYGGAGRKSSADLDRALDDIVETPAIGAIAAVEMARMASGWTVEIGAKNGLPKYKAFVAELLKSGWFTEPKTLGPDILPGFSMDDPVGSLDTMVATAHPDLDKADQRRVARALLRSIAHALGPDGVPVETIEEPVEGLLGKTETLEKRVTTVASSVLGADEKPVYHMNWNTTVFTRTKTGKDKPKNHTKEHPENHKLAFNLDRWQTGDRSALLDYYRYVEEWLKEHNSAQGRTRTMACFAPILDGG